MAAVPLGFTTWAAFLYIGIRTKRAVLLAAAGLYAAMFVGFAILDAPNNPSSTAKGVAALLAIGAWIGGTVHALVIRRSVNDRLALASSASVSNASHELARRAYGRELIRAKPELARQLGIGRPDVQGADSFGLVDINHANAAALASLPGISPEAAAQITTFTASGGSFISVDDLALFLDLPPRVVEELDERAVFVAD